MVGGWSFVVMEVHGEIRWELLDDDDEVVGEGKRMEEG